MQLHVTMKKWTMSEAAILDFEAAEVRNFQPFKSDLIPFIFLNLLLIHY